MRWKFNAVLRIYLSCLCVLTSFAATVYASSPDEFSDLSSFQADHSNRVGFGATINGPMDFAPDRDALGEISLTYQGSALWQGVARVAIRGNYLYCFMVYGLKVFDISNPALPVEIGQLYMQERQFAGVFLNGNYAYVTDLRFGDLLIIDIANPTKPELRGKLTIGVNTYGVAVSLNYAYVASQLGLYVVNVSNPTAPSQVIRLPIQGSPRGVALSGGHAFVANLSLGLQVINIVNPNTPFIVATQAMLNDPLHVTIGAGFAFVSVRDSGFQVVDISNPEAPQIGATYRSQGYSKVVVSGGYLYVSEYDTLKIFNVSSAPELIFVGKSFPTFTLQDVDAALAVTSDGVSGVQLINSTNPNNPIAAGSIEFPPYAACYDIEVVGSVAYVAGGLAGLRILNVADPSAPTVEATWDTPGTNLGVLVVDSLAFLADGDSGLIILNISDPYAPSLVGAVDTPSRLVDLTAAGSYLFASKGNGGMAVLDISEPQVPFVADEYNDSTLINTRHLFLSDTIVYLADEDAVVIVNVAEPLTPALVGRYDPAGPVNDILINGIYGYVANANAGLRVIDLSDPQIPALLTTVNTPDWCFGLNLEGNYLYVADYTGGVLAFNVSNPSSPVLAGEFRTLPGWTFETELSGSSLHAVTDNGLLILGAIQYLCGDADNSEVVDISDVVRVIAYIFTGGAPPNPYISGDADCNELIDISDAVFLIAYIFNGGPTPCPGC